LVTLIALVMRLPHWRTIPAAGDEVGQAVHALKIAQGQGFPLVGNDPYSGPFFFYLLALLLRLGVADPFVGRAVLVVAGTLTATVTYAWVRLFYEGRGAGLVAGLIVAVNPHLILLNSHLGGGTYLLPCLTTTFLWLLFVAIKRDHTGWLIAAGAAAGLAIQANPIAGLLVAGSWLWALFRARRLSRLGKAWPLWPIIGVLCVVLAYGPVIIYNVTTGLESVAAAGQRSYLWQTDPNLSTTLRNGWRLILQLIRQVSGVVLGDETLRTLLWVPLLYAAWMLAGLIFCLRRVSKLPLVIIAPFFVILPYFSVHYGMMTPVRFTSLLTPVFAACMGSLAARLLDRVAGKMSPAVVGALILMAALLAHPVGSLFEYYDHIEEAHASGHALMELSRQMVVANQGEPVYISNTGKMLDIRGIPYVPHAYLLFADLYQEFLPPEQIIGRLFERPGPAMLLLSDEDVALLGQVAGLERWRGAANEEARYKGYGLYSLDVEVPLVKPDYVWEEAEATGVAPDVPIEIVLGSGVELVGYDVRDRVVPGKPLKLIVYWRAVGAAPEGRYIGFVHLLDPAMSLAAQDDHLLGGDRYPLGAWQLDEVVVERYTLPLPEDAVSGQYALLAGIYSWPDLARFDVPGHPDDVVVLGTVEVGQ
jgi:hypothetical protein